MVWGTRPTATLVERRPGRAGLAVDRDGACLCGIVDLVWREVPLFRALGPAAIGEVLRKGFADDRDPGPIADVLARMARILDRGEVAQAQILGMFLPFAALGIEPRLRKAYDPDEPRVPAGSGSAGGQWTSGAASSASPSPAALEATDAATGSSDAAAPFANPYLRQPGEDDEAYGRRMFKAFADMLQLSKSDPVAAHAMRLQLSEAIEADPGFKENLGAYKQGIDPELYADPQGYLDQRKLPRKTLEELPAEEALPIPDEMDPVQGAIRNSAAMFVMVAADGKVYGLSGLDRAQGVASYRVAPPPIYAIYAHTNQMLWDDEVGAAIASGDIGRVAEVIENGGGLAMGAIGSIGRSSAPRPAAISPQPIGEEPAPKPTARGMDEEPETTERPRSSPERQPAPTASPESEFERTPAVQVSGRRAIDRGKSYEEAIRQQYGNADLKDRRFDIDIDGKSVSGIADDVIVVNGTRTAIEVKYVGKWDTSPRNPDSPISQRSFMPDERAATVEQAKTYQAAFKGGVIYVTSSEELAKYYDQAFRQAGIEKFRFIITPTE